MNIVAVIVTYNRLSKLQYALECYDKQTIPFNTLIVVDNNSTDGTIEYLKDWELQKTQYNKHVIYLPNNVGGSGGFYAGEKYAMTLSPDWVYIADDDAYPEVQMIEKFYKFQSQHQNEKIAAVCTSVWDMTDSIMYSCRCRTEIKNHLFSIKPVNHEEYSKPYFTFNCLSYVGGFISAKALEEVGLVNKDFFIYQDDVEHSMRLSKYGVMYCIPDIKIIHDSVPGNQMTSDQIARILWKEYYAVRNRIYMLLKNNYLVGILSICKMLGNIKSRRENSLSACDKMTIEGCKDALIGKLGLHSIYRPGLDTRTATNLPYPTCLWQILYWVFRLTNLVKKI